MTRPLILHLIGGARAGGGYAKRAKAGSDFAPIFFMIEARWFSTVRWLRIEVGGDILTGMTGKDHFHDLALP